ncbi:hypothetical protein HNQ54_002978 [Anaerocolumna cellulosilytica]|nr:hypothetical protein [Anaerocolumna cellulosilytica]
MKSIKKPENVRTHFQVSCLQSKSFLEYLKAAVNFGGFS